MNTIISTVKVTRAMTATVLVEHPATMTADEVMAGLKERAMDFAGYVSWWDVDSDDQRTEIASVALGVDESEVSDSGNGYPEPRIFELMLDEPTIDPNAVTE